MAVIGNPELQPIGEHVGEALKRVVAACEK
jgi:hypothetical protein